MFPLSHGTREKVKKLHVQLQLYHRLHCEWWNCSLPGTTFSMSATAVLGMYVGLRHPELPWYLYWIFWFTGFGVLSQIFGTSHDIMYAKDRSNEVLKAFRSPVRPDLNRLSVGERKRIHKESKAMTSLQFRIAGLTNYSWAVPFRAWDEILRQLLFFLSL